MAWFYILNNQQKGPLQQTEFDGLVQQGTIGATTLVWREGMANWQAYGDISAPVLTALPQAMAPSVQPNVGGILCSQCGQGFPLDQVIKIGNQYVCAGCKPLAVQKLREGVVNTDAEQLRKEHINHEASVKAVGFLYFLGAAALFLIGSVGLFAPSPRGPTAVFATVFIGLAALQIWAGIGLRRLSPWARIPSGILSGFGLLGFPIGTLINGYILYLLFSKKGSTVFSEEYKRAIEQTPNIRYRTSLVVWILLALLLLLVAGGVLMLFLGFS